MFQWKRKSITYPVITYRIYTSEEFIKYIRFWDWKAYKTNYKDVHNFTISALLVHALKIGIPEKRNMFFSETNRNNLSSEAIIQNFHLLLPKDFDTNEYISLHSDLANMGENDAKGHYILYGNLEKRGIQK